MFRTWKIYRYGVMALVLSLPGTALSIPDENVVGSV